MKLLALFLATVVCAGAAPFEIKEGDRVLLLGDALLERENTYGLLETRMHEQFPKVKFTVRNLSWSGETPKGWSRASFDGPEKGWERLKEQIAEVKPTVAILGFGMAASLQEMTDRSGDQTLNPDPVRYGAEPMSAARFKKELAELMDAINERTPDKQPARFVLLSPIEHQEIRAALPNGTAAPRPGAPDPAPHNALLKQYTESIKGLAVERAASFVPLKERWIDGPPLTTENGIHLDRRGYDLLWRHVVSPELGWGPAANGEATNGSKFAVEMNSKLRVNTSRSASPSDLTAAILRKNDLFFHQFRPANSTYLFGFRKHEQGKNAAEMPKFTPLIEAADAEIDRLKRQAPGAKAESPSPGASASGIAAATSSAVQAAEKLPLPNFTVTDNLEITLWADTDLVGKPVGMNWDARGRLWVACSPVYPQITPGGHPDDKVVVIEDTDHDGKADKSTNFATNFIIAAGVAPDFGTTPIDKNGKAAEPKITAAYVGASTELVRVEDTDGDGIGDTRRIIVSGLGTEDTHHTVHTLRWGPDGRLYFNQSIYIHSHMETPYGMVRLNSGGICCYDPRTERIEVFARGFINTWGHAWDKWGQSFATDGAGFEGVHWLIPGAMYRTYEGARRILPSISPGSYPKYSGLEIVQSPLFPDDWQGNAITCDFRAHKITRFQINDLSVPDERGRKSEAGSQKTAADANPTSDIRPLTSGYITKELPNPVVTSDASFRPIDVKHGPDGALYIADWTNPIINHGEVDFRDPRRDHVNGRIWRVAQKGKAALKWEPINGDTALDINRHSGSRNLWSIEQSRPFLRDKPRVLKEGTLTVWDRELREAKASAVDFQAAQVEALNIGGIIYDYTESPKTFSFNALEKSPNPRVRAIAVQEAADAVKRDLQRPVGKPSGRDERDFGDLTFTTEKDFAQAVREQTELVRKKKASGATADQLKPLEEDLKSKESELAQIRQTIAERTATPEERDKMGIQAVFSRFEPFIHDKNPRVRVEAMRALARIPTVESVSLVLEAAINAPGGTAKEIRSEDKGTNQFNQPTFADAADPYYGYAAWLSVNDLAPQVMEWIERESTAANPKDGASGAGAFASPVPDPVVAGASPATANVDTPATRDNTPPATRDAKIAYALQCLRPEQSSALLSKIVQKRGIPKDGSGPWIELIGQAGGPAELRVLLDGLLANTVPDGDMIPPLADKSLAFTNKEANRRAAAALVVAAKRGVNPANPPYGGWQFHMYAPDEAIDDVIRLAGLWKQDVPYALIARITDHGPKERLDAIFESLRTLGTDNAANYLTAFLEPKLAKKIDNQFLNMVLEDNQPAIRRRALGALAGFRPDVTLAFLRGVLEETDSAAQLPLWRELFSSDPFTKALLKKVPQLTKEQATPALRAARELGKRGEKLVAALTPLAGEAPAAPVTYDIASLVDLTKKNGNPVEGELIYRRAALTCTVCHAIGGAGGKVAPDLGTIGASAPLDYIIESTVNPGAKVKEGFHAIAVTTKDGKTLSGTVAKESDTNLVLRDMTGAEQSVEKSNVKERTNIGSLMPAGLTATLNPREQSNLFAFLAQLGKSGPFDASKASIARAWRVYPGDQVDSVVAGKADAAKGTPVYSLVDGRVTKEVMEIPLAIAGDQPTLVAAARFALINGGQHRLHLAGITKAWLDGQPLAIASDPNPVLDLPAGEHALVIKLDTKTLPAHFRAECPDGRFLTE